MGKRKRKSARRGGGGGILNYSKNMVKGKKLRQEELMQGIVYPEPDVDVTKSRFLVFNINTRDDFLRFTPRMLNMLFKISETKNGVKTYVTKADNRVLRDTCLNYSEMLFSHVEIRCNGEVIPQCDNPYMRVWNAKLNKLLTTQETRAEKYLNTGQIFANDISLFEATSKAYKDGQIDCVSSAEASAKSIYCQETLEGTFLLSSPLTNASVVNNGLKHSDNRWNFLVPKTEIEIKLWLRDKPLVNLLLKDVLAKDYFAEGHLVDTQAKAAAGTVAAVAAKVQTPPTLDFELEDIWLTTEKLLLPRKSRKIAVLELRRGPVLKYPYNRTGLQYKTIDSGFSHAQIQFRMQKSYKYVCIYFAYEFQLFYSKVSGRNQYILPALYSGTKKISFFINDQHVIFPSPMTGLVGRSSINSPQPMRYIDLMRESGLISETFEDCFPGTNKTSFSNIFYLDTSKLNVQDGDHLKIQVEFNDKAPKNYCCCLYTVENCMFVRGVDKRWNHEVL